MVTEIHSLQHPLVKHWVKLRTEKSARAESNQVLLMGSKMVRELATKIPLQTLISTNLPLDIEAKEHIIVTEAILQKITGLSSPDKIVAIAPMPKEQSLLGKKKILILDQIADPGNLGTLLRTALAFNWDGIVFTPGSVDPFNDKALRASKGAIFSLPFCHLCKEEVEKLVKPFYMYIADLHGIPLPELSFTKPLALVLSNEGAGARSWESANLKKVLIPMNSHVESLNVAMSGSILLYSMSTL